MKSKARLNNILSTKNPASREKNESAGKKFGARKGSTSKSYGSIKPSNNLAAAKSKSMQKPATRDRSNKRQRDRDEQRNFMRNTLERY